MSDTTKTAILKIEIDQKSAAQQLVDSTKNVTELKTALTWLNDAYKKGKVEIDSYAKQKIELEGEIKKETQAIKILQQATAAHNDSMNQQKALLAQLVVERNNLNRSTEEGSKRFDDLNSKIKSLNESLLNSEKGGGVFSRNVGNYREGIRQFAEGVEIGELSLGRFINRLSFLNAPAVAAASAITLLGSAYASSAVGAKDLEEAQNQLKAQWEVFSGSVGGETGGEGPGLLTRTAKFMGLLGNSFIGAIADAFSGNIALQNTKQAFVDEKQIDKVADAYNKITELQFEQIQNETIASKQRKEAFELTVQREDKEKSLNERLEYANRIVELQKKSVENNVEALKKQAQELVIIGDLTNNNVLDEKNISSLRKQYLQLLAQINNEEAARQRRISQAERSAMNITLEIKKQNEELAKQNRDASFGAIQGKSQAQQDLAKKVGGIVSDAATDKRVTDAKIIADSLKSIDADYTKAITDSSKSRQKEIEYEDKLNQKAHEEKIKSDRAYIKASHELNNAARVILGQQSAEYKAFSTAQALIGTYTGADKALAEVPYPANLVAAASVIAEGLANVIQINKAAGGGTFETKGPTMLLVGDNPGGRERIDVTPLSGRGHTSVNPNSNLIAMAGGGSLVTNGGLVTNQMSNSINSETMMANMFKNMPQPIISWKEGLIVDARIKYKEGLTSR